MAFKLLVCVLLSLFAIHTGASALKVTLYEESLCPYCRRYIHRILSPLFRNGLSDFVDLHIVAVGNAIKVGEGELKCQHGPEECVGNRIINCAIHLHPQPKIWFPFVDCLERGQNFTSRAEKCAQKHHVDGQAILSCADGPMGKELVMKAYNETAALVPPHTWVPWVVVDGQPLFDGSDYLQNIICVFIPEGERPDVCYKERKLDGTGSKIGAIQQQLAGMKVVAT